ncbi:EAL domain-containing protein [Rhodospirillum sp. A1_3_36]|uniref:EAL domain-containing protein n=1 Tax=Rhodospirillum sp. A1_3_36 TaxID=3391666 RepID=UPI0039A418DD
MTSPVDPVEFHSPTEPHRLVFDLAAMEQLREVHGSQILETALGNFRTRMEGLARRLAGTDIVVEPSPGRDPARLWFLFQPMSRPDLPGNDPVERLEAMAAAGGRLAWDVAAEVFGVVGASHLAPVAIVAPPPPSGMDLAAFIDELVRDRRGRVQEDARVGDLLALLNGPGLRVVLQPIVSLTRSPSVLGYEALARGPQGSALESAGALFETADNCGQRVALEEACAWNALALVDRLPAGQFLTVNASSDLLANPALVAAMARPGVVVELTEHLPLDNAEALLPIVAVLRQGGARLALDDAGCGFADTKVAAILRPDIVKLCITVVRNAALEEVHRATIQDTVRRLQDLGCQVLAEGVETETQADRLESVGATLAQGWYFGRPAPADEVLPKR